MDEIEFDEALTGACECCGASQQILTRYVMRDGSPFAIYKAVLTAGHGPPRAQMVVGFGRWDEAEIPSERIAITFDLWSDEHDTNVTIVDAQDSAWSSGFLGNVLPREEAVQHPLAAEVFSLVDHVLLCDEPVKSYLG
jgi:hypothetical protein